MDLGKIAQFVRQNGDKCIVLEDGSPALVVMSYGEYEKLAHSGNFYPAYADVRHGHYYRDTNGPERGGLPIRPEDVRLEDLPI